MFEKISSNQTFSIEDSVVYKDVVENSKSLEKESNVENLKIFEQTQTMSFQKTSNDNFSLFMTIYFYKTITGRQSIYIMIII